MIQNNKYIRFDWAIKRLLRNKAKRRSSEYHVSLLNHDRVASELDEVSHVVLEGFLSVLLNDDIKIDKYFFESEGNQETSDDKYNSVDLLCEDSKGTRQIIEIQNDSQHNYYIHRERDGELNPHHYVLKVNDFDSVARTPLDEWVSFLKTGNIEDSYTAKGLPEAREKLRIDRLSDDERRAYIREMERRMVENDAMKSSFIDGKDEGRAEGRAEGLAEGLAKGLAKGILAVARNLKLSGMSLDEIAKMTGLPLSEIDNL